jgi:cellulose binding protein with CBM3 domain
MRSGPTSAARGIAVLAILASACASGDDSAGATGDDGGASGAYASSSGSVSAGSVNAGSGTFGGSGSVSAGTTTGSPGNSGSVSLNFGSGGTGASGGATGGGLSGATETGVDDDAGGKTDSSLDSATSSDATETESSAPPDTGLSVLYQVGPSAATSAYLGCELSVQNSGSQSPAISTLKVRYYFTDQVHLTPQMTINWSHISTSGANADVTVTFAFFPLVPAAQEADTYIEFGFSSGHSLLGPGESTMFSWQMQGPDPAKDIYTQTADYSFDPSKTALASWDHVVLLENGSVVWGVAP